MAIGEVFGGLPEGAAEYKVPVYEEPSVNLPVEEPAESAPLNATERLNELIGRVRELGTGALDRIYGAVGGEHDRHLRQIDNALRNEFYDKQEDETWLHVFNQELENGTELHDSLKFEVKTYDERIQGRQEIIEALLEQRTHAQGQDVEAPR
jgi:hypothetical protein